VADFRGTTFQFEILLKLNKKRFEFTPKPAIAYLPYQAQFLLHSAMNNRF